MTDPGNQGKGPTVADRRFVADTDIFIGTARAYTRGQAVQADAVEANGWEDYVVAENSKEARQIKAEITGRDPADFETKTSSTSAGTSSRAAGTEQKG